MLLPSKRKRRGSGLRAALRDARDTYRERAAHWLRERPRETPVRRDDPDVVLDVQHLHVDEIDLKLDELKARVALEAHVLDLLRLDVGVDAELRGVGLQIKGVDAQALLKVRLENLTVLVDRVMSTVDRNPQIIQGLTERLGAALEQVGSGAAQAVGNIGEGAGAAVRDIGESAGSAVEDVGGIARALAPDATHPNGDGPHPDGRAPQ